LKLSQVEKSEKSKNAILEAALALFSTQGYRYTSTRDIAAAAGMSTGSLYHHFPEKEALFISLLNQYWEVIESPEFPFNKALIAGAFPDDLEALSRAAQESMQAYRLYVNLIYIDVVEFEGKHVQKYYTEMPERFNTFLKLRYPGNTLEDKLAPGFHPSTALMLVSLVFLQYFAVESLIGVPRQFGMDSATAMNEVTRILHHGMLRQAK
jgi:AcrR family transcriptional regulator